MRELKALIIKLKSLKVYQHIVMFLHERIETEVGMVINITYTYDGIRQGPEPGIGTGGYELGTGAVE